MKTLELIAEEMGGRSQMMAAKIIQMAEASAYDVGAEEGNVTSDAVFEAAKQILADIEQEIGQQLQVNMDADTEHQMGADRNMEMGETNFKEPDRF